MKCSVALIPSSVLFTCVFLCVTTTTGARGEDEDEQGHDNGFMLNLNFEDKISKSDLLVNVGKQLGQDLMMTRLGGQGPQMQKLMSTYFQRQSSGLNIGNVMISSLAKAFTNYEGDEGNEVDVDDEVEVVDDEMKGKWRHSNGVQPVAAASQGGGGGGGGYTTSFVGWMLGNLASRNPQLLVNMIQEGISGGRGGGGEQGLFSFESVLSNMLSQVEMDIDTVLNIMASAFRAFSSSRGDDDGTGELLNRLAGLLQLEALMSWWSEDFISSPTGQKFNRELLPRLRQFLQAKTWHDALHIIKKKLAFIRCDTIIGQIQDDSSRKMLVAGVVRLVRELFRGIRLPSAWKQVINKAEDLLNNNYGFRDRFSISTKSLVDLSPSDIERVAGQLLEEEVLQPMIPLWEATNKAIQHPACASFIFCQLNYNNNYRSENNLIGRYVVKTFSIILAFQAFTTTDDVGTTGNKASESDPSSFSKLFQAINHGADGADCTHGVPDICLDLMHTAAVHNEL